MSEFLIVKNIIANDVNFEQNFCVAGNFPAITSFIGMVHSTTRLLPGLKDLSVCPIIHYSEKYNGYGKTIPTIDEIRKNSGASLNESVKGSICFSLIIELDVDIDYNLSDIAKDFYDTFQSRTLSGGMISLIPEDVIYCRDIEGLLSKLKEVKAGRVISDATDLLFNEDSKADKLDELIDIVTISKDDDGNILPNKYDGYLIPIAIGYAGLESIKIRAGRKGEMQHSFVEPVIGLGDIIVFSCKKIKKIIDKKVFWCYDYNQENKTYLCVGKTL